MSNKSNKPLSEKDANQTLLAAYNDTDATLSVSSFVTAQLNNSVQRTIINPTTDNWSYFEGSTLLYKLQVVYDDSSHSNVNSVTRIV